MSTTGAQYDRWRQATSKELQAFLKTAWKEPTPELRAWYFATMKKVNCDAVASLQPQTMTAEKKAQGLMGDEHEKARVCLQGQNHEGFQVQNSTTNADAHLLRLFLAFQANPKHVILTQLAPELIQLGLVQPGTLYQCTKACYGLREAPKLWGEARDKQLTSFVFQIDSDEYSLRQSTCRTVRLSDDSDRPDISDVGEHKHNAAFLVYVDDFLPAGPQEIIQPLLARLLDVWKGSNPDFLGRQPGDVDNMRFLGLDIELGPEEGAWLVHQQSYIYAFLQEMCDPECLKDCRTPVEPESFSDKPHVEPHAEKARLKHPPLQPGQDPLEHSPVLRLVGVLWVSLRTRPDVAWAAARITRLASSEEACARVCIRHVAQYLRWTLHFALFYEPVQDLKWHCYTDAIWAPEGDYSHQAVAIII